MKFASAAVSHLWVLSRWSGCRNLYVQTGFAKATTSQRWSVNALSGRGPLSLSLSHCLNLSQSPQRERWLRGFSANDETSVCEPPSPTSPSPLPTPHHMMAWVGLPLWVTQLWGAVLVRPLSPVSEPRLMIAGDDPVVFPSSHTPLLPLFYLFFCLFLNHLISIFYFSLSTWVSEIVLLCKRHISFALELADFSFPALPAHKILTLTVQIVRLFSCATNKKHGGASLLPPSCPVY